jgi:dTDP-4-amino-4,6-dideoxygalactose transaminase
MENRNKMTSIPVLDLKAQYAGIKDEISAAIGRVLESQHFILGEEVEALEAAVAEYSDCRFGIGVSSGTDALLVSLMALGIQPGDEVITTSYSFFATAGAVARLGAVPVFADIDPVSYNIDPVWVEQLVTPKTKAVIPVHFAGQAADMEGIMHIAEKHNLAVVEDACQAIGADFIGRRAGSIGALGCFSFFPSKNLGGYGDSGMVTTNDPALADRVRLLRNHGHKPKYYNKIVGGNFRMDAIQAAVLNVKFKHLEQWTEKRRANAKFYRAFFVESGLDNDAVQLPQESGFGRHIYHLFVIRCRQRDALRAHLETEGIGTEIYYPVPLHLQECFSGLGYRPGSLPASEALAADSLALPIYPEITEEMQRIIVSAIKEFYSGK